LKWLALFLCLAVPATAQVDPCPLSDRTKLIRDWRAVSQLLYVISYRKECGAVTQDDLLAIRSIHLAWGCPADSGVGRYYSEIITAPLTQENEHPGLAMLRQQHLVGMVRFCEMADALTWPSGDASFLISKPADVPAEHILKYQQFWAHVEAMQAQMTHLLKGLHSQ